MGKRSFQLATLLQASCHRCYWLAAADHYRVKSPSLAVWRRTKHSLQRHNHRPGHEPEWLPALPRRQCLESGHFQCVRRSEFDGHYQLYRAECRLHPDFGSGEYQGSTIGIPYLVVDGSQGMAGINFTAYGDESDPGPMPIPAYARLRATPIRVPVTGTRW